MPLMTLTRPRSGRLSGGTDRRTLTMAGLHLLWVWIGRPIANIGAGLVGAVPTLPGGTADE